MDGGPDNSGITIDDLGIEEFLVEPFQGPRGRPQRVPDGTIIELRQLTAPEATRLNTEIGTGNVPVAAITEIRQRHHYVAQLVATGMKDIEVMDQAGISSQGLYRLKNSPAFTDLVAHYADEFKERIFDVKLKLQMVTDEALSGLLARLEEGRASVGELKSIAEMGLNRTGYPAETRVQNRSVSVSLTRDDIQELKNAAAGRHRGSESVIVEHNPNEGLDEEDQDGEGSQARYPHLKVLPPAKSG